MIVYIYIRFKRYLHHLCTPSKYAGKIKYYNNLSNVLFWIKLTQNNTFIKISQKISNLKI